MLNPPLDPPCIATVDGYLERVNRGSNVACGRGDYSRSAGRHHGWCERARHEQYFPGRGRHMRPEAAGGLAGVMPAGPVT